MAPDRVPKIVGGDVEFGNFIEGVSSSSGTGEVAARLLLREIPGVPATAHASNAAVGSTTRSSNPQDRARRFLVTNGGCAYIDLDHLELATPEVRSAYDYVAYTRAMVRLARAAVHHVNAKMPAGARIRALANCSDGHGHSYGAHMNVLLTRRVWDEIVRRKPHHLACLAAFQVSSIVLTGAGKVGSENGRPAVDFQISQRADFFEAYLGEQTTYNRPIVNARCEPLCGGPVSARDEDVPELARLHVIFFDATLCQTATLLRAGTLQMLTAMLEAGRVPPALALDDPLDALQRWSHDPSLAARARLVSGHQVTAVELQERFLDHAREHAAAGGFEGAVPRAGEILALWADALQRLREGDFETLARRLDWVLKRQLLRHVLARRPSLSWSSAELRHLDQLYASVDEAEGLFWPAEDSGCVDTVVTAAAIQDACDQPPDDTRAWARTHLLRRVEAGRVELVDWDRVVARLSGDGAASRPPVSVQFPCPYRATRRECEAAFAHHAFDRVVAALASAPAIDAEGVATRPSVN